MLRRSLGFRIGCCLLAIGVLACAGVASGAMRLAYATPSSFAVGAAAPPLAFAKGAQADDALYVKSFTLSGNRSSFSATLRGVPQATVVLPQLSTLENTLAESRSVTLTAPTAPATAITTLRLDFLDGANTVGTLDLRAASPSTTFALAGGQIVSVQATIGLAEGAGNHNVVADLSLDVTTSG